MSDRSATDDARPEVLRVVRKYYHVLVLGGLIALMLSIRLQAYDRFVREDGSVLFGSNDPWYHFRETTYAVENWPYTMPYDPWTGFPSGRTAGQFGTLWDQLVATVIVVLGLGDPGPELAGQVMLVATPVMAALCAIPVYLIARRFVDRPYALLSVLLLALIPGQFLGRSLVGSYQHHAAETFFISLAAVAFMYAFVVAVREQPIWELVVDRELDALRRPLASSILAGVALALYMSVWQPGVLMVGITGTFIALKMTSDVYHGDTPEPIGFVAAVSMTVAGLLMIIPLDSFSFGTTAYSYTQVGVPLVVAVGAVFLAYLARQWEARDLDRTTYPAVVVALGGVGVVVLAVAIPDAWSTISSNFVRFIGFGAGAEQRTIAEAQPMLQEGQSRIFREYGLTMLAGFVGLLLMFAAPLVRSSRTEDTIYAAGAIVLVPLLYLLAPVLSIVGGWIGFQWQFLALVIAAAGFFGATLRVRYDVERLFFLVWSGFLISAAFTQIRFNYYLVVPVVISSAFVVATIISALDVEAGSDLSSDDVEGWQVILVVALLLALVVPVLIVPIEVSGDRTASAFESGANNHPGETVLWSDSLDWLSEETPYPGEYAGSDNPMEYYGTYDHPPDGDFEYDDGVYGVMAWWDYGHWITAQGERIPVANPFQQNARNAANFLIAPDEATAEQYLYDDEGSGVRYVMLDYSVADVEGGKYQAPTIWYDDEDIDREDLDRIVYQPREAGGLQPRAYVSSQRSYESIRHRLFAYHGSAKDPEPIVVRYREESVELQDGSSVDILLVPERGEFVEQFDTMEQAREAAADDPNAQVGGIEGYPEQRVEALETYRLVHTAAVPANFDPDTGEPHVKTFERVEGATIEGEGAPPNTEVEATVQMTNPMLQQTFEYTQYAESDGDGEFELTVPYSTTGYDEYGTDAGYTDVEIQAAGAYTISTTPDVDNETLEVTAWTAEANVTEGQVLGEVEEPVVVELEEQVLDRPDGATDEAGNGEEEQADDESG